MLGDTDGDKTTFDAANLGALTPAYASPIRWISLSRDSFIKLLLLSRNQDLLGRIRQRLLGLLKANSVGCRACTTAPSIVGPRSVGSPSAGSVPSRNLASSLANADGRTGLVPPLVSIPSAARALM